LPESYKNASVG